MDLASVSGPELSAASPAPRSEAKALAIVYGTRHFADVFDDDARDDERRYECECTEDRDTVLELARSFDPEILVVDADLAGAQELVDTLLEDAQTELLPIVVVGAFTDATSFARYAAVGVSKTLVKPITMEALRLACTEAIDQREGRTIRIELPDPPREIETESAMRERVQQAAALLKKKPRAVMQELLGRRIVVADDDPAMTWFLSDLFRRAGADVVEARDGRAALAACREKIPSLLVTDIVMPGIDGLGLCRALNRDAAMRDVPIMLLSWKEDLLDEMRERAGAAAYLVKSETPEAILKRACEVLHERTVLAVKIAGTGEVRGRLDGVSTRSLLEMVRATRPNARVLVTDGACLYEIEVRDGAPKCATRSGSDGRMRRGPMVFATALGLRSGRYGVIEHHEEVHADLEGDLDAQLAPIFAHTRAMRDAATGPDAERVHVDIDTVEDLLNGASDAVRELAIRIANGETLRSIVASGTDPSLLEEVLCDLAARSAIVAVDVPKIEPVVVQIHAHLPLPPPSEPFAPAADLEVSTHLSEGDRTDIDETSYGELEGLVIAAAEASAAQRFAAAASASANAPTSLKTAPIPSPPAFISMPIPLPALTIGAPTEREDEAPPTSLPTLPPPTDAIDPKLARAKNRRAWAVAAVTAFGIAAGLAIRWTTSPSLVVTQAAAARAPTVASSASPPANDPNITDLTPADSVPNGEGMLEVTTAADLPIRIDGIDRGRGPKLRVAVASGSHTVRVGAGPSERTRLVDVRDGHLTRVEFSSKSE